MITDIIFCISILILAVLAIRWQVGRIVIIMRDIRDELEKLNRRND